MPLSKLDMRCWTGPEMDIPIPGRIRSCLDHFSARTAEELLVEYGMVRIEIAESLHQRSKVAACRSQVILWGRQIM